MTKDIHADLARYVHASISKSIIERVDESLSQSQEALGYVKSGTKIDYWEGWDTCAHVFEWYFMNVFSVEESIQILDLSWLSMSNENTSLIERNIRLNAEIAALKEEKAYLIRVANKEIESVSVRLKRAHGSGTDWRAIASALGIDIATGRLKRIAYGENPTHEQFVAITKWLDQFEDHRNKNKGLI